MSDQKSTDAKKGLALRPPTPEEIAQAKLPARYEAARTAIAECERIDELKDLADRQMALAAYARQAKDDSLRLLALRIQARAERRCGQLLKQIPSGSPSNLAQHRQDGAVPSVTRTGAASEAGLSERQRKTALRVANVPEAEFERAIESPSPPTVTQLAERGKISRANPAPAPVAIAAPSDVAEAQSALAAFAEFCAEHDAARISALLPRADARAVREHIARIDDWLGRFLEGLSTSRGAAA